MVRQLFFRSGLLFSGLVLVKLLSTFVFIFLAKFLLPDLFGQLSYFLTLISLFTLVSDWGLIQWFQIQWSEEKESELVSHVFQARICTLIISISIFAVYNSIFQVFSSVESILFVVLLIPEAFLSITDAYYLVHRQSQLLALKQLSKYIFPVLLIVVFQQQITFLTVVYSFVVSSIFTSLWYLPYRLYIVEKLSISSIKKTLKESSTYATLLLTSAFYSRGDALVLENTLGHAALGIYSAGYRYLDAMSLFPGAFSQNLFHLSSRQGSMTTTRILKITAVMGLLGMLFGGALYLFSHFLTVNLLGIEYQQTEVIVKIFSLVTVLMFINSPLSTIVQSSSIVKKFLPWGIVNTVINIVLNVLLIPVAGGVAAAGVMLITEATGLLINIYFVKQTLKT